jgi:hypothetical protein
MKKIRHTVVAAAVVVVAVVLTVMVGHIKYL